MPRLLLPDWIKKVAVNHLLQLYEKENKFVLEWEEVRRPFVPLIEQYIHANCLPEVEHILLICPPDDLIAWASDLQKLRSYFQSILGNQDLSELQNSYDSLREQLKHILFIAPRKRLDFDSRASHVVNQRLSQ